MSRTRAGVASPWRSRRPTRPRPRSAARAAAAKISRVRRPRMTDHCWRSWSVQGHDPDTSTPDASTPDVSTLGGTEAKAATAGRSYSRPSTSKRRFHRLVTLAHALVPPPLVLALTPPGGLPYKARDFGRGDPRSSGWTKDRG